MRAIIHSKRTEVRKGFGRRSKHALFPRSGRGESTDNCWIRALLISNPLIRESDAPNKRLSIYNTLPPIYNSSVIFYNSRIFGPRPILSLFFIVFKERRERERDKMNPTVFRVYKKVAQQLALWKTRNCWRLSDANPLSFKINYTRKPLIQQSNSCAAPGGSRRPCSLYRGSLKTFSQRAKRP